MMNLMVSRRSLLLGAAAFAMPRFDDSTAPDVLLTLPIGKGNFLYTEPKHSPYAGLTIPVYTYRPEAVDPKATDRILFVMHGMLRNGADYRDQWIEQAEKYHALLLVPQFSSHDFPEGMYNRGNVRGRNDDQAVPPAQWTFPIIERLFRYIVTQWKNPASGYYLYGHSAGGQFVHRLVEFLPEAHIKRAVAANAGYYTLPDRSGDAYPFSRTGTPEVSHKGMQVIFERKLVVLLGEADTDPNDPDLYHSPEADKQGLYRFARGQNFLKVAQEMAKRDHLTLKWRIETVPGVGHSNEKMAPAAAHALFETV